MLVAMYLRGTKLNKKELAAIVILGTLAASWRSECVYYLVRHPGAAGAACARRLLRPLAVAAVTALVLVGYFVCSRYSSALMGEAWQYKMIALCYQTAALVQDADPVEDAEALAAIDRVFDVTYCRANSETHGNELRRGMIAETGGSAEDWSACQKAIIKLASSIPRACCGSVRVCSTTRCVSARTGQSNQKIAFSSSFLLYEAEPTQDDQKEFFADSVAVQPLNKELRRAFIIMASHRRRANRLTWWMLPPFVLLCLAVIVLLVQRKLDAVFSRRDFFCADTAGVFDRAGYLLYVLSDAVYRRLRRGGRWGAVRGDAPEIESGKDHGLMRALYLLLALVLVLVGHTFRLLRWEQFIRIYERPMPWADAARHGRRLCAELCAAVPSGRCVPRGLHRAAG